MTRNMVLRGGGLGRVLSQEDAATRLEAIAGDDESADWAHSELPRAGDLSVRFGVPLQAVDALREAGKIVALTAADGEVLFPLRQFRGDGTPADGIREVLSLFTDAAEAWEWLVLRNRVIGGVAAIDALRDGRVDEVLRAAEGRLDYA